MSLSQEERTLIVGLQKRKAESFLGEADFMADNKLWDGAANRYYYAIFHMLQALLITNGLSCHTHKGLISMFHLHFVKTRKAEEWTGSFVARMEQLRERADYNCSYDVTETEINEIRPRTHELLTLIETLI